MSRYRPPPDFSTAESITRVSEDWTAPPYQRPLFIILILAIRSRFPWSISSLSAFAILKGSLLALFQTLDGFESAIEVYGEAFLFLPELVAHYAIVFYLVLLEEFSKPHLVTIKSSAFMVHKG